MVTQVDERKGLVKTTWRQLRSRIKLVEPRFTSLVDELDPDDSFPIYLCYYPFGEMIADVVSPLIPKAEGGFYKLSDPHAPKDVIKHLGYGMYSSPLAMVLENEMEFYIDFKEENITTPWFVYTPGSIFAFKKSLNNTSKYTYAPNGVLSIAAGRRSTFMLPNIGSATNHACLQRDFNVKSQPPKTLYEHWNIFKEILNSPVINSNWRCCIIYFSEKWIQKIHTDKAWVHVKIYLHELAWNYFDYERNRIYYDLAFSLIQKKRNLKPNPYLADTARHIFTNAIGAAPAYAPACNSNALPLDILQKVYVESYGMKKYIPTIMQTAHFDLAKGHLPVYYSLKNPSTHVFSPKSRKLSSTLFEMHELEHIMRVFREELSQDNNMCSGTIIQKIAQTAEFRFYHNEHDRHHIIMPSQEIEDGDPRFKFVANPRYFLSEAKFAADAPFVRGCISIKI